MRDGLEQEAVDFIGGLDGSYTDEYSDFGRFATADPCPLVTAAASGWVRIVECLLDRHVPVDSFGDDGSTPLFAAVDAIDEEWGLGMLLILLRRGADPNLPAWAGIRPLTRSVYVKARVAFQVLLIFGADPNLCDEDDGFASVRKLRDTNRFPRDWISDLRRFCRSGTR